MKWNVCDCQLLLEQMKDTVGNKGMPKAVGHIINLVSQFLVIIFSNSNEVSGMSYKSQLGKRAISVYHMKTTILYER